MNASSTQSAAPSNPRLIRILAIDGGGIRGILPAKILAYLATHAGRPIAQMFDLIAGTSTGGILALGLGTPAKQGRTAYSPDELADLYLEHGAAIFSPPRFPALKQMFGPKYSPRALEQLLAQYFGDTSLRAALTPLLITSYDLRSQLPFFFKSHRIAQDASYDVPVRVVARATSAAPTYFPPLEITLGAPPGTQSVCLIDGGIFANNPAMAAYAEARRIFQDCARYLIVSVGTGNRRDDLNWSKSGGWGLLSWAKTIVPIFMDSASEAIDYEMRWVNRNRFHRFQCEELPQAQSAMDNASPANLKALQETARRYIKQKKPELDALCEELVDPVAAD